MVAKGSQNSEENRLGDGQKTKESAILTEEKLYASDIFRMFCYKVLPCTKVYNHNWKTCPFLHEGEKAGRRDPQKHRYVGIECHEVKQGSECSRGNECPYAHNLFEFWLHPTRYRTQLCNKPASCRRKVCFFAHNVEELRQPSSNLSVVDNLIPTSSECNSSSSSNSETENSSTVSIALDSEKNASSQQVNGACLTDLDARIPSCQTSVLLPERNLTTPSLVSSFSGDYSGSSRASSACSPVPPRVPSLRFSRYSSAAASSTGDFPSYFCRPSPKIPDYSLDSSESVPESELSVPFDFPLEALFPTLSGSYVEATSDLDANSLYTKQHLLSNAEEKRQVSSS